MKKSVRLEKLEQLQSLISMYASAEFSRGMFYGTPVISDYDKKCFDLNTQIINLIVDLERD